MKITAVFEETVPISSPIRSAYVDFSQMTTPGMSAEPN